MKQDRTVQTINLITGQIQSTHTTHSSLTGERGTCETPTVHTGYLIQIPDVNSPGRLTGNYQLITHIKSCPAEKFVLDSRSLITTIRQYLLQE